MKKNYANNFYFEAEASAEAYFCVFSAVVIFPSAFQGLNGTTLRTSSVVF